VYEDIVDEVMLCAEGLSIDLTSQQIRIFVQDLVELYTFETMEDIFLVLKQGRQGSFGTSYNKLNMVVFRGWMEQHQDLKAEARELAHNVNKSQGKEPLTDADIYGDFAKKEEAKKPKTDAEFLAEKDRQIKEYRDKYFKT